MRLLAETVLKVNIVRKVLGFSNVCQVATRTSLGKVIVRSPQRELPLEKVLQTLPIVIQVSML